MCNDHCDILLVVTILAFTIIHFSIINFSVGIEEAMSTSVRNPVLSGRKSVSPPSKNSTRNSDLASDEQSDDDSIEDSDESDSDDISALNNDSLYSADTYAGSYGPDAVSNPRNSTSGTTVSPMQSNRSSSTRRTEPQAKSRAYADEEQGRGLETIDEEGSDEDDGKRDDDDEEDSEDDDSSEGSYDSGSSENTSEVLIYIVLSSHEFCSCNACVHSTFGFICRYFSLCLG